MAPPPPLLGYNNNVRHRGRIFHIQTEDSGIQSPRIKTHLFADGGRIVRSTRTDYSEYVGQPDMAEKVKNLMKEQHKAMFVALRSGQLDATIGFTDDAPAVAEGTSSVNLDSTPESLRDGLAVARAPGSGSLPSGSLPSGSAQAAPRATPEQPAAQPAQPTAAAAPAAAAQPAAQPGAQQPSSQQPSSQRPGSQRPGSQRPGSDPAPRSGSDAPERPYAAPRPAAIFSAPPTTSIFGDVGIDEKSLDDAILSYLAEDPQKPG